MMKKNNRQNEFIFAVVAIILTIVFLGTLFYVKSKNIEKEEIAIQPPITVSYFSAI
jgi:hypothetical protein